MAQRDYLLKGSSATLRFALVGCTRAAEAARLQWRVRSAPAAALLGRALASASLLAAFLKGEERVALHWLGAAAAARSAPVSEVYAEALPIGEVRGYLRGAALPGEGSGGSEGGGSAAAAAAAAAAAGWDGTLPTGAGGAFTVSKVLYGERAQHRTTLELARGDIASEVAHYYAQSEQREAEVRLDAAVDPHTGRVTWCAGMLLEALPAEGGLGGGGAAAPGAATFVGLRAALRGGAAWPQGLGAAEAAAALAPDLAWGRRVPLDFFCRCTAAGFLDKLVGSCPRALLEQMLAEAAGGVAATLVCSFCNKAHDIAVPELQRRLASA
jgi:molecular chaperone Hsp33